MDNLQPDLNLQPASFKKRLLAGFLDLLLTLFGGLTGSLIVLSLFISSNKVIYFNIFFIVFIFLVHFLNAIVYQVKTGRTFGKFYTGLKVCYPNLKVDVRSEDLFKREFSKLITLATAGYSFFSKYKEEEIKAFHDEFSNTVVLNLSEEHEKYLYDHYYEEYFHSEEEDQEYLVSKEEQLKLEKEQKQLEKEQKLAEKEKLRKAKLEETQKLKGEPSVNIIQSPQTVNTPVTNVSSLNQSLQAPNNETQNVNFNSVPPTQPVNMPIPENGMMPNLGDMNQIQNGITPSPMIQPNFSQINTVEEGVNIVGQDNILPEQNKSQGFFKGILSKKSPSASNSIDNTNLANNKLSDLVQDHTFLPSEKIFSEVYKGWTLANSHQDKDNLLK